eukprot:1160291-Pelagomonas_calceolata.AAC.2
MREWYKQQVVKLTDPKGRTSVRGFQRLSLRDRWVLQDQSLSVQLPSRWKPLDPTPTPQHATRSLFPSTSTRT